MSIPSQPAHNTPTSVNSGTDATPEKPVTAPPQSAAAVALTMSWQLLVILVVPLVGGHLLDVHYKTSPVWMCLGMAVALVGIIVVVRQTVRQLNEIMRKADKGDKK